MRSYEQLLAVLSRFCTFSDMSEYAHLVQISLSRHAIRVRSIDLRVSAGNWPGGRYRLENSYSLTVSRSVVVADFTGSFFS